MLIVHVVILNFTIFCGCRVQWRQQGRRVEVLWHCLLFLLLASRQKLSSSRISLRFKIRERRQQM